MSAVMVHWANPQLSLLALISASGFLLQAPVPEEGGGVRPLLSLYGGRVSGQS